MRLIEGLLLAHTACVSECDQIAKMHTHTHPTHTHTHTHQPQPSLGTRHSVDSSTRTGQAQERRCCSRRRHRVSPFCPRSNHCWIFPRVFSALVLCPNCEENVGFGHDRSGLDNTVIATLGNTASWVCSLQLQR